MRIRRRVAGPWLVLVVLSLTACSSGRRGGWYRAPDPPVPHSPPPPEVEDDGKPTRAEMRSVNFHSVPGVALRIRRMSGTMTRTDPARPAYFDDPKSFRLNMAYADVAFGMSDLANLMNDHVFAYPGSPLDEMSFEPAGERLRIRGKLLKPVATSIEMVVDLCVAQGDICMRPVTLEAAGLGVKGLFKTLGIQLDKVMDVSGATGIRLVGNDMLMDPETVLATPPIQGEVTGVRMEGNEIVMTFGRLQDAPPPARMPRPKARAYMFFEGGTMRFGRLYMIRSDMQLVDADPKDPFDFDLARYDDQLVAGYSKNQPDGGLVVMMPDLDDVDRGVKVPPPKTPKTPATPAKPTKPSESPAPPASAETPTPDAPPAK